jgi:UDP-N-acetylglucosamine 2-epimerase (non-hydrolysing)
MPEEINRILTDEISDYFFVTEQSGIDNLVKEGKPKENIFFVGNTMIDTLVAFEDKIGKSDILEKINVKAGEYALMTMHRPATVDHEGELMKLIEVIEFITESLSLVFPIHPRTTAKLKNFGLLERIESNDKVILSEPMDYFSFQRLCTDCRFVITDSGGIQEETTFRKIPCLTLRPNTERPSTITIGTNELVPFDVPTVKKLISDITGGTYKKGDIPPLWDGNSTQRILETCMGIYSDDLEKKRLYSI